MKTLMRILATFAVLCIAAAWSRGTEHHLLTKLTVHQQEDEGTNPRGQAPTQDEKLKAEILKQRGQIEKLRRKLVDQEGNLDRLLARRRELVAQEPNLELLPFKAHDGDQTRKVAILENINGQIGLMNCGSEDGFREGDHIVFVQRINNQARVEGTGIIARVYPTDAELFFVNVYGPVEPEDEIYISNRDDSIYSLALIIKPRTVARVLNTSRGGSGLMNCGSKDGFRKGDRVVFVRRTGDGFFIMGQGTISVTYPSNAEFHWSGERDTVQPEDEVYISSRSDSIHSLALLRF